MYICTHASYVPYTYTESKMYEVQFLHCSNILLISVHMSIMSANPSQYL